MLIRNGFVAPLVLVNTPKKLSGQCAVLVESQLTMGPFTTPKKRREVGSVDPWTPTSNLKMLISAASPEIRNREKELCMDTEGRECVDSAQVQKRKKKCVIPYLICQHVEKYTFLIIYLPVGH